MNNLEFAFLFLSLALVACAAVLGVFALRIAESVGKTVERVAALKKSSTPQEFAAQKAIIEKPPTPSKNGRPSKSDVVRPALEDKMAAEVMEMIEVGMSPDDAVRQVQKKYKTQDLAIGPIGGDDIEGEGW